MKTQVSLRDENSGHLLFDGEADVEQLSGGGLVIEMKTQEGGMIWKVLRKGIIIENVQELKTILRLYEKGSGSVRIFSPYGEMESVLEQVVIEKKGQSVTAAYHMPEAGEFRFCLTGQGLCFEPVQEME